MSVDMTERTINAYIDSLLHGAAEFAGVAATGRQVRLP
jgi:hypothetical protein